MPNDHETVNVKPMDHPTPSQGGDVPPGLPPQEVKPSGGNKLLAWGVCLVLAGGAWWAYRAHLAAAKSSAAAPKTAPTVAVVTGRVQQRDVPIYLDGLGTVQAFNTVTVHVRVDGQIEKIAFVEGQDVRTGDLLAQIDPAPFRTLLEQAQAKKIQDQAQLTNAQLDLKRDEEQITEKIIAQQVYDTQKALVNQLDATVKADQAAIDSAQVQLDYTTVTSPLDGRTGIRTVDAGNIVHATDVNGLVVITQLRPISVVFTLPEQNFPSIQKQLASGKLTVVAVDRDNSTVLGNGELAVVDNLIDTTTGTLRFKATFPNTDLRLWPGQFVNARLLLTTRKDGLVVPASVVQRGPDGPYAFVVGANQTVEVRPVKVAQIEAGRALIDEGLQANEQVVVDGQYRLQAGSHVKEAGSTNQAATAKSPAKPAADKP